MLFLLCLKLFYFTFGDTIYSGLVNMTPVEHFTIFKEYKTKC